MAIARLPVILVLVISLLQFSKGQCGLCINSNLGLGNSLGLESLVGVITPAKPNIAGSKCGNNGCNCNTNPTLDSLQFLNLQQPYQTDTLNLQPLSVNLQSALGGQQEQLNIQQQNVPQSVIPCQQPITSENAANLQVTNQQLLLSSNQKQQQSQLQPPCDPIKKYQYLQASLNLQPINLGTIMKQPNSQSSKSICLNDLQATGQQAPIQQDINVEFLPMVNGQAQGLPTQVSQGTLLSNLGLSSNLPSILTSFCKNPSSNQFVSPQNNAVPNTDARAEISQTPNGSPLSASNSYMPDDRAPKKPTQILLMPLSFQDYNGQKPQTSDLKLYPHQNQELQNIPNADSQIPIQVEQNSQVHQPNNQPANQPALIQTYPSQNQNVQTYTVQNQDIPLQQQQAIPLNQQLPQFKSSQSSQQSASVMSDPVPSIQYKEQPTPEPQIPFDGQSNSLASLILSQLQSSNYLSKDSSNQAYKASSMKSLLPILLNLLKDNNGGCCCPNCNCGYMNNGPDRRVINPCINNPFTESYSNNPSNTVERAEKQEEPTTNTYLIYNNTPYKADNGKQSELKSQPTNGFANQIKYGQPVQKDISQNVVELEERAPSKLAQDKKKTSTKEEQYKNSKKIPDESIEYENDDEYGYSYENED